MRNIFSIILVCLLFISCSNEQTQDKVFTSNKTSEFTVSGMMCEKGCKSYLTNQIVKMHGVVDCEINFSDKTLTVDYNNKETSINAIVKQVAGLMDGKYSIELIHELEDQNSDSNLNTNQDNNISVVDFGFQLPNLTHLFTNWL